MKLRSCGLALLAVVTGVAPVRAQEVTLAEAAALALAHHPALAATNARSAAADAAAGVARAARLPTLLTEASAVHFQEPMIVAPLHELSQEVLPDFDRTLIQSHVVAAWTLYDGGARGARVRQADARVAAAEARHAEGARRLIAQVADAYLRVRLGVDLLSANAAQRAALVAERERVQRLLEEGKVARVAVLRADAALARARADSVSIVADRAVALADLARLTGVEGAHPRPVDASALAGLTPEVAHARARAASAELQAARAAAVAADAAHAEARSAYLPRIDLSARYNEYGSAAGDFSFEWQGGVLVSYPVFTGRARGRRAEQAAAEARAADADAAVVEMRIAETVDRALAALTAATARVDALELALAQQEEVVRIERLARDAGAGVQTDYLAAEAELLRTRAALTESRHAAIAARIELARVTGELTTDWLGDSLEQRP